MKTFKTNMATNVIMVLILIQQIIKIVSLSVDIPVRQMMAGPYLSYDINMLVFASLLAVATVLSLIVRNSYFFLFVLLIPLVRTFVQIPFETNISYAYLLGRNFADLFKDLIPLCICMCFNGGWKNFARGFQPGCSDDEIIGDFQKAWATLDASLIIKHLAPSFQYESQWVFDKLDMNGYKDYISGKFETLKKNGSHLDVAIVPDPSFGGKMLRIKQQGNDIYYRIKTERGKVVKGDLCML